jgi:SAM-dependent methyltransferase
MSSFKNESGYLTLKVIEKADKFNRYMFDAIKTSCRGNILEIGSGIGNISQFFLQHRYPIMLSDFKEEYCETLRKKFIDQPTLLGVHVMNIEDAAFDARFSSFFNYFDTILALNVFEHLADDSIAFKNCHKLLKDGGRLIILVPAYPCLYNGLDEALDHYRRYTLTSLSHLFTTNNFKVICGRYFNFIGIIGWYFVGKILKRKQISHNSIVLFNLLMPLFKLMDQVIFYKFGLSVLITGQKSSLK